MPEHGQTRFLMDLQNSLLDIQVNRELFEQHKTVDHLCSQQMNPLHAANPLPQFTSPSRTPNYYTTDELNNLNTAKRCKISPPLYKNIVGAESDQSSCISMDTESRTKPEGDFWDVFTMDDSDGNEEELTRQHSTGPSICYSPLSVALTILHLLLAAFLLLVLLTSLVMVQLGVISLSRYSKDDKLNSSSQLLLLLAFICPSLISLPLLVVQLLVKTAKGRCAVPHLSQLLWETTLAILDSLGHSVLLTCVLPKLDCAHAVLLLSAVTTLPPALLSFWMKDKVNAQTLILNKKTLVLLLQTATLVSLTIRPGSHNHAHMLMTVSGVMISFLCHYATGISLDRKYRSKPKFRTFSDIYRCIVKVLATLGFAAWFWKTGAVESLTLLCGVSLPRYLKLSFFCVTVGPLVAICTCRLLSRLNLCQAGSFTATLTSPIILAVALILSISSNDLCLARSSEGDCVTPVHFLRGVLLGFPLTSVIILWCWSHCSLIRSKSNRASSRFSSLSITSTDLFILRNLISNQVKTEKLHRLDSKSYVPYFKANHPVKKISDSSIIPTVYVCATMWHETQTEMKQLLHSLFKLDEFQFMKRQTNELLEHTENLGLYDPEFFNYEAHIMFDDAMDNGSGDLNGYITKLSELIRELIVEYGGYELETPVMTPTPYGGKLTYFLPGHNSLIVHMKNKSMIRNKKRWSMVQYMYYLLGYRLLSDYPQSSATGNPIEDIIACEFSKRAADNTFLLTVDGDVDFEPESVQELLNELRQNSKLGVVCGRIHPVGSGLIVWYQRFEYAIAHWLNKTAERVLGVVLCTPGAFSMFRASSLMDDNIMRKYAQLPHTAKEVLQREQGEDRWLCTLMLQQGHRCEYVPTASALTFAPETIHEFFNQRRRWGLSSIVNHLDLLITWKNAYFKNQDISLAYISFQVIMFLSTIVGPAFVLNVLAYANQVLLGLDLEICYAIALAPVVVYTFFCMVASSKSQIDMAAILGCVYGLMMLLYLISSAIQFIQFDLQTTTGYIIALLSLMIVLTAILHPTEFVDILPALLYYLAIPTNCMLLMVFCMMNLDNVSWGTRETKGDKLKSGENEDRNPILRNDLYNPVWSENEKLKCYKVEYLDHHEMMFWNRFMDKYLRPNTEVPDMSTALRSLRNQAALLYFLLNILTLAVIFSLQKYISALKITPDSNASVEPVSVTCIIMFAVVLIAQFLCLVLQRFRSITTNTVTRFRKVFRTTQQRRASVSLNIAKSVIQMMRQLRNSGVENRSAGSTVNEGEFLRPGVCTSPRGKLLNNLQILNSLSRSSSYNSLSSFNNNNGAV